MQNAPEILSIKVSGVFFRSAMERGLIIVYATQVLISSVKPSPCCNTQEKLLYYV